MLSVIDNGQSIVCVLALGFADNSGPRPCPSSSMKSNSNRPSLANGEKITTVLTVMESAKEE